MNSTNRFVPDAAYALRKADAVALTASTKISAGELVSPIGAPWNDVVKDGKVVVFYKASALDRTTNDETYKLAIITSESADLSSEEVVLTQDIDAAGWNDILVDQVALLKRSPTHKYWGIALIVGGTTPSAKLEAYVLPPVGH